MAIAKLIEHLVWADNQIAAALRVRPDPRALELFAHVVSAELLWLDRIAGLGQRMPVWPRSTLEETVRWSDGTHARLGALAHATEPEGFYRPVTYRTTDGREFTSTVEDILVHVAMHGQHHRGQITTRFREAGSKPPSIDFIAWARGAPTATSGTAHR